MVSHMTYIWEILVPSVVISVSRLDTMISSGVKGINMIRSVLVGVSVSRLDTIVNSGLIVASM